MERVSLCPECNEPVPSHVVVHTKCAENFKKQIEWELSEQHKHDLKEIESERFRGFYGKEA